MQQFKSVQELASYLASNPEAEEEFKKDPKKALSERAAPAFLPDTWIYRLVVTALGLTILIAVAGAIYIAVNTGSDGTPIATPEILVALGSAAVGALAGLLAPSPRGA